MRLLSASATRLAGFFPIVGKASRTAPLGPFGIVMRLVRAGMRVLPALLAGFAGALRIVGKVAGTTALRASGLLRTTGLLRTPGLV